MTGHQGRDAERQRAFAIEVHHMKYLPRQARQLHAVVSVTARGLGGPACGPRAGRPAAEVILVDTSGSMDAPPEKMRAARKATAAAIAVIRDGVLFAVAGGAESAKMIYPRRAEMVTASAETRAAATRAVGSLMASGGTAIGSWLTLARQLFSDRESGVRHALLFTDGHNRGESAAALQDVLAACHGQFVCDPRGIGDGWSESELHGIASALNGSSDAIRAYADMADDFRDLMQEAMGRVLPDVSLRIFTPGQNRLRHVRQAYPVMSDLAMSDLAGQQASDAADTTDYYTGSWGQDQGDERRDYEIVFDVDSSGWPDDEDTIAGTLQLVVGSPGAPGGLPGEDIALPAELPVLLQWTADPVRLTQFDETVVGYAEQREVSAAVRAGNEALSRTDTAAAVQHFGRAARLAFEGGYHDILDELETVVEIVDAAAGEVRLLPDISKIILLSLAASTRHSVLVGESAPSSPSAPSVSANGTGARPGIPGEVVMPGEPREPQRPGTEAAGPSCGTCQGDNPPAARFCEHCGSPVSDRGILA